MNNHQRSRFSFVRGSAGSTAVSFALALPAVLGVVGLAADFGLMQAKRLELQQSADSAAVAAIKELTVANSDAKAIAATAELFTRSAVESASPNIQIITKVSPERDAVTVELREEWTPFFAHFLKADVTPIVVQATARLAGESNICVLVLNPSDAKSLHMDQSGRMQANGCAIYSNASHSQGITLDAASELAADMLCSAGGVKANKSAVHGKINQDCPKIPDPLESRVQPKVGSCDFSKTDIKTGTRILSPGTYCGGLKISGDANVTFETGEYVVSDGDFEVSDSAVIKGENVAFFLHGDKSTLQFTENSTLELSGAKSGGMAGLLFFEDRSAKAERKHRIQSANARKLTGTIYLPRGSLRVDPNSSVAASSDYTAIIVNKLEVLEGSKLVLNSNYENSNVPVPVGIRLTDQIVLSK